MVTKRDTRTEEEKGYAKLFDADSPVFKAWAEWATAVMSNKGHSQFYSKLKYRSVKLRQKQTDKKKLEEAESRWEQAFGKKDKNVRSGHEQDE